MGQYNLYLWFFWWSIIISFVIQSGVIVASNGILPIFTISSFAPRGSCRFPPIDLYDKSLNSLIRLLSDYYITKKIFSRSVLVFLVKLQTFSSILTWKLNAEKQLVAGILTWIAAQPVPEKQSRNNPEALASKMWVLLPFPLSKIRVQHCSGSFHSSGFSMVWVLLTVLLTVPLSGFRVPHGVDAVTRAPFRIQGPA